MDESYFAEKFCVASEGLKRTELPKREALLDAYIYSLIHAEDCVPAKHKESMKYIQSRCTLPANTVPLINDHKGTCRKAISMLSSEEIDMCIQKIHQINDSYE